jgi:hypothetical protein
LTYELSMTQQHRTPNTLTLRTRRSLGGVALLALVLGGCREEATEIVGGVTTQIQVPKYLKTLGMAVQLGNQLESCDAYPVHDGSVQLPSTLGVIPDPERDGVPSDPVTVHILGFRTEQPQFETDCLLSQPPDAEADGDVMVVRRRRLTYVPERILYLPMPLRESCDSKSCDPELTCVGGVCEDINVASDLLVDYQDSLVFGNTNTCFSLERCLSAGVTRPATLVDPDTCTFHVSLPDGLPVPAPESLNVQLVYASLGTEVLDLDEKEGFVLPDPADPTTFRLASNLCSSVFADGKILNVLANTSCPAKRPLQPICDADLAGVLGGLNPFSTPDGYCTQGLPLRATESALYVLMDRSSSMSDFFGPTSLKEALDATLSNPMAARIRVAFDLLPADAGDCAASPYDMPLIAFDDVDLVQPQVADVLGDTGTLLADDPMLFLDAAMTGAYQALSGLTPVLSNNFNRRALVVVGNRDVWEHCGGATPVDMATQALASDDIRTYVVLLEAPGSAEQFGRNPVVDGGDIAGAGGTTVYLPGDSTAVHEIVQDIGTCVYDAPGAVPTDAVISYRHPVTLALSNVEHNASCTDGANVSGWNQSGTGPVRICGDACNGLRQALTEGAAVAFQAGEPAASVPIIVRTPCE